MVSALGACVVRVNDKSDPVVGKDCEIRMGVDYLQYRQVNRVLPSS